MRTRLTYLSVLMTVAAALVVAVVLALGGGGTSGTASAAGAVGSSPRAILEQACAADRDVTSGRADFRLTLTPTLDPAAEAPAQARMALGAPIEVSGDVAVDSDPFVGAINVEVSLGDGSYTTQVAMRWIDDEAWVKVLGLWYQAPPEAQERLAEARARMAAGETAADDGPDADELASMGLDPWSWITGLELVDSERIDGVAAHHIGGGLDVAAMIDDLVAFSATPQFEAMLREHAPAEALAEFRSVDRAELDEAAAKATEAVRDVRGEVWVAAESGRVLKAAGAATLVPPAEADVAWLESIAVAGTVRYGGFDEPVTVQPPADPRPWDDLQRLCGGHDGSPFAD